MKDLKTNLNWKTAAIVGAIAISASLGVCYYLRPRKKLQTNKSLDIDDLDSKIIDIACEDPRQEALRIKEKGNSNFKGGRYEIAIKCYSDALAICPAEFKQDKAILYQNRAVAYDNLKMNDKALEDLNASLSLNPKYEKALIRRSRIFEDQGKYREALIDITAAAIFNNFKMGDQMNRMEQIVKNIAKLEVDKELSQSPMLQSDSYIKSYLDSFPNDPFLRVDDAPDTTGDVEQESIYQSIELFKLGKFQESYQAVQKELLKPELSEEVLSRLYLLRATFYLLSCREDLALDDLTMVIKNNYAKPAVTVNALIKRAMIMLINDNSSEVEKAFTEALQIDPQCPDIYYHRGSFFENIEKIQEAINDYKRALEFQPMYSYAEVHKIFNESRISSNSNYFDEFKNLIEKFPSCMECNIIFAQVLLSENKVEEAERVCDNLLLWHPKSGTIVATLAMVKLSQNKIVEARRLLNDSIKDDPICSYSYNTLATIYIKEGDLQKALELLDSAVKYSKNRQEMQNFIATREGVRAQLIVSVNYAIPPKEIFAAILQGLDMPANYL